MSKKPVTLLEGGFEKKKDVPVQTVIDLTNPAAVRLNLSCGNCGEMPDRIGAKYCIKCGSDFESFKYDYSKNCRNCCSFGRERTVFPSL